MPVDAAFYSSLRKEFESLERRGDFSLLWTSRPAVRFNGELLPSQWTWRRVPDESLRARLSALALKAAKALGYDSEEAWFDELRKADFVQFDITGSSRWNKADGTVYDWESGKLADVVKHSITHLYVLESRAQTIGQPGNAAQDRIHAADAEGSNTGRKGRKRGPTADPEMEQSVARIVCRVAPEGNWCSKLDEVCEALDEAEIPCPSTWRKNRKYRYWRDCFERELVVKAIEYRLKMAKQRGNVPSETLS